MARERAERFFFQKGADSKQKVQIRDTDIYITAGHVYREHLLQTDKIRSLARILN